MKPRSTRFYLAGSTFFLMAIVIAFTISDSVSAELRALVGAQPMVTLVWDGGGATNNWSDGANWTGDIAPGPIDGVVFDGTSTKNAVIDIDFSISSLQIFAGYSGTISQGSSNLTIGSIYEQASGTFVAGNGALSVGSTFRLDGGSFTAPTGTLNFPAAVLVASGASFNPNGGTVAFVGVSSQLLAIPDAFALNNVIVNKANNTGLFLGTQFTLTVNGTLSLTEGAIDRNSIGTVDARGDVLIAPTFDTNSPGNAPAFLTITGSATRTVTFPVGARMPPLTVNAPNTTLNFSGTGTFTFGQNVDVQAASFSNGAVNVVADSHFTTNGFTQGSGSLTFNFDFTQTGGTFNPGSGARTFNSNFTVSGGTFNAPSGNLNFSRTVTISAGAVFNHNNGTLVFNGPGLQDFFVPAGAVFPVNNLVLSKAHGTSLRFISNGTVTILGTLTLTEGGMDLNTGGTRIDTQGELIVAPTFDGSPLNQPITLQISGSATRTISFPVGALMLPLIVNAPNVTVNTIGAGTFTFSSVDLQSAASFTNGSVHAIFNGPFTLGPTGFTQGAGNASFESSYTQNAGTFTSGTGALDFKSSFDLNGGTFNAPAGSMSFFQHILTLPGATFNPNGGTVVFTGVSAQQFLRIPSTLTLHNVIVNRAHNTELFFFNSPTTLIVIGTLSLVDGRLERNSTGTVDARGDISVASTFDGGAGASFNPAFFLISGGANQTYTNSGGVNPGATWTINKSAGTLTAASSLILQTGQTLNLTSGTLYLNENSNLTAGAINIGSGGRLVNDSSTTITLGGNLSNSGTIDLNGGGASCPGTDSILIRSSSATQRSWTGGRNRLIDVDVQNMGGTGTKTVFSGTNSGGNNANWVFETACPTEVSISPGVAGVPAGNSQIFTASGGVAPYTFSVPVNNSGATIGAATGIYTAGATMGVADTVRVTDGFGSTTDATVNVVGLPFRLAFTVQPSASTPGQTITPSVTVATQDANGNLVTTIRPNVVLSIGNNPHVGTLSGTLTKQITNGVAVFDDLSINLFGNGYTLRATGTGLQPGTSEPFNVRNAPGIPTRLAFLVQPADTTEGIFHVIRPLVEVGVVDDHGNSVPDVITTISVIPDPANPTGLMLSGGHPRLTQNGTRSSVTFSLFTLFTTGPGQTIVATSTDYGSVTSVPFTIYSPTTVFSANDTGPGSLREAIEVANSIKAPDLITFNIPGPGPHVINTEGLPSIEQNVSIDATTQPGYAGLPLVEIRNVFPVPIGVGLSLPGSNTVKGLAITRFAEGIRVFGSACTIQKNYIGTNLSGNAASPNTVGINIMTGSEIRIGGPNPGEGNVISGNLENGIFSNGGSSNREISGNLIGTDATGTTALPNGQNGIRLIGPTGFTISGNVISGNLHAGISIFQGSGSGVLPSNVIQNNIIGMDSSGANVIGNGRQGVLVDQGEQNDITQNRIFGNGTLGIQLGEGFNSYELPPLPNNPGDVLNGGFGNRGQNYPVLDTAISESGITTITGSLNSNRLFNLQYRIDFYSSRSCDPSGHGEGEAFIGSTAVTTNNGLAAIVAALPVSVANARFITSTATDPQGNTSEFSNCTIVGGRYSISGQVRNTNRGIQNALVVVTGSNGIARQTLSDGGGQYFLTGLPNADYTVTVSLANHTFGPPSRTYPNLLENHTFQDFGGTISSSTLSGQVTTLSQGSGIGPSISGVASPLLPPVPAGGFPLFGVTFNLTGPVNRSITNDSLGNYRFDGLPDGTYTLTPSKPNYVFSPPTANVLIAGGNQTTLFSAQSLGLSTLSGRIVYDSLGSIKAMNADGSGVVSIARTSRSFGHSSPRLSANGARAVHVSHSTTNTNSRVISINADGTGPNVLSASNNSQSSPTFSRDGSRVAFNDAAGALMTMNVDGSNVTRVISRCAAPDWSPDGSKIVCLESDGGSTRVKVVEINSTAQTVLDGTSGLKFSPRWSPDGTKIAFIRRQPGGPAVHSIVVKTLPVGTDTFMVGTNNLFDTLSWSPDGGRLLFTRDTSAGVSSIRPPAVNKQLVTIQASDGQNMLVIVNGFVGNRIDWSNSNTIATPPSFGTATTVQSGAVTITMPSVTGPSGVTTITPIEPHSAGVAPNGYVIGNFAFEVNTTAVYPPPATICVDLDELSVRSRLMHSENGVPVNITTSFDDTTGILCGQANSFSPFVVAEEIDPALASITGLVIDSNGDRMSGVAVSLTGAESDITHTDSDGLFKFVNLMNGANYNVQPQSVGYIFTEYSQDLLAVAGENTVVFTGTESLLQIAGRIANPLDVSVAGVTVTLDGAANDEVVTDAGGNYLFTGLPADGSYWVTPSSSAFSFSPGEASIGALTSSVSGVNFTALAPTAASVSVSGQVLTADGRAVRRAMISLTDAQGIIRMAVTNTFGYYRFEQVEVGSTYFMTVAAKGYQFENPSRTVTVNDELTDINFTAGPEY